MYVYVCIYIYIYIYVYAFTFAGMLPRDLSKPVVCVLGAILCRLEIRGVFSNSDREPVNVERREVQSCNPERGQREGGRGGASPVGITTKQQTHSKYPLPSERQKVNKFGRCNWAFLNIGLSVCGASQSATVSVCGGAMCRA